MIIKYCPKCAGNPYTKDFSTDLCINCGSTLLSEIVNEDDLIGRTEMTTFADDYSFGNSSSNGFGFEDKSSDFEDDTFEDDNPNPFGFGDPEPSGDFGEDTKNEFELPSEHHSFGIDNNTRNNVTPSTKSRNSHLNKNVSN